MAMFDTSDVLANMLGGKSSMNYGRNEFCSFEDLENEIEASDAEVVEDIEKVLESDDSTAEKVEEIEEIIAGEVDEVVEAKDEEAGAIEAAQEAYHDSMMVSMLLGNESLDIAEAFGCEGIGEVFKGLWEKLVGMIKKIGEAIAAFFRSLITNIKNRFKGVKEWSKEPVKVDINTVKKLMGRLGGQGVESVGNFGKKVTKWISADNAVLDNCKSYLDQLIDWSKANKDADGDDVAIKTVGNQKAEKIEDLLKKKKEEGFDNRSHDVQWKEHQFDEEVAKIFKPEGDKKKWPKGNQVGQAIGAGKPMEVINELTKLGKQLTEHCSWAKKKIEEMKNMASKMDKEEGHIGTGIKKVVQLINLDLQDNTKNHTRVRKFSQVVVSVAKRASVYSQNPKYA